ncbi:MAG: D-ribose pyranase [Propionibacteriaceae bacterium]|jgi:D-ribose pyranase|nr:D-ribose pyranase [Propionibacteriaceae bacterium]
MRKHGILHPDLAYGLATLGHQQTLFIVDAGMPLPVGVPTVDLALVLGVPRFTEVLDAVLAEIVVEDSVFAAEAAGTVVEAWLRQRDLDPTAVTHEELKARLARARLIVRTGEATSYANVELRCGVAF